MSLEGKTIVITGASSGIGAETARVLADAGMNLVLHGRREDRLAALASEIGDGRAKYVAGDIVDPATPKQLIACAVESFGTCDAVFNNAGVLHVFPIDELDIDTVCEMVRINVEAAYRLAYEAVMHFRKHGGGDLINTSSILGTKTRPTAGWYAGTKYAIEALSEALRMELAGQDIRVFAMEPGVVATELHREWDKPAAEKLGINKPLVPADIARCVKFMLEQPRHVNIPRMLVTPSEQNL